MKKSILVAAALCAAVLASPATAQVDRCTGPGFKFFCHDSAASRAYFKKLRADKSSSKTERAPAGFGKVAAPDAPVTVEKSDAVDPMATKKAEREAQKAARQAEKKAERDARKAAAQAEKKAERDARKAARQAEKKADQDDKKSKKADNDEKKAPVLSALSPEAAG